MEFKQEDDKQKGRFYLSGDSSGKTEITYTYFGARKIIISHTGVSEAYRGKDVGKKLVNAVVSYARENEMKILPLCPFAKAIMTKDERFSDVLV